MTWQAQQNKIRPYYVTTVTLSLYLAYFVPGAVGFYWICSNLLSIAQVYLLLHWRTLETLVDLADLADSQEALANLKVQVEKRHFGSKSPWKTRKSRLQTFFLHHP